MAIKNVLVVDDSPTEVHLLREMLTKNGFAVSVANSGEEAITRAAARLYLSEYIEIFYNRARHQSALGHHTPLEYRQRIAS